MTEPSTLSVAILRGLVFVAACWTLRWSWRGALELARGRVWPPSLYQSQIFWTALAAACFGLTRFFGGGELWRGVSFSLMLLSLVLAGAGHRLGSGLKARQFYAVFDHLDLVLAIVTLAKLAPAQASEMADECRRRVAVELVARADG